MLGQCRELPGDGSVDGLRAVARKRRAVLDRRLDSVAFHAGQV